MNKSELFTFELSLIKNIDIRNFVSYMLDKETPDYFFLVLLHLVRVNIIQIMH